jgi:hypothetical protein
MGWNIAPLCVAFDCLVIPSEQNTHFHACEWSLKWSFAFKSCSSVDCQLLIGSTTVGLHESSTSNLSMS